MMGKYAYCRDLTSTKPTVRSLSCSESFVISAETILRDEEPVKSKDKEFVAETRVAVA